MLLVFRDDFMTHLASLLRGIWCLETYILGRRWRLRRSISSFGTDTFDSEIKIPKIKVIHIALMLKRIGMIP
jgi:hypothetical protein